MWFVDFPECDGSPCQQMCNETDGSFQCSCTNGYLLANDSRSCNGMSAVNTKANKKFGLGLPA